MFTTILTTAFVVSVAWSAIVGFIRGLEKTTIRLITLALTAIMTFLLAGPVTMLIVQNVRIEGLTLGEMLLESLLSVEVMGQIIHAAPLMREAILVAPAFVIAVPVFPLVFLALELITWIVHLFICKPLRKLLFNRQEKEKPPIGVRIAKRFAGMGIGLLLGVLMFFLPCASLFGWLSFLPQADTFNQTLDIMVEQKLMMYEDAEMVRDVYAITDSPVVKVCRATGVTALGRNYLNTVSTIEADGQTTCLGDEMDSLMAVFQTSVEGGLVQVMMAPESEEAVYAVLSDPVFVNALAQDMFRSKLLRAAAPELMSIAMKSVAESMSIPGTKDAVYNNMMNSVAQAVRQADIDYAGIAAYEQAHGITQTVIRLSSTTGASTMTEEEYQAEVQKLSQLAQTISSILNRVVAGDDQVFADSVAEQIVRGVQTQAAAGAAVEQFDAAAVQTVLAEIDPENLTAEAADAAALLEQLQDPEKFETDLTTAETIVETIRQSLQEALADDEKAAETARALANIVSNLVGAVSGAKDEQGNMNIADVDFGKIADAVTELQNSPLKDVGSSVLDMVGAADLGDNEMVGNLMDAVKEGYENGEDVGGAIGTAGALIGLGSAAGDEAAMANSLEDLINNLNEFTIGLLPQILTEDTIASMGVPADYAGATYNLVETLMKELLKLQGAADYENEVQSILALYNLVTGGVENFTEADVKQLVGYAVESDAIYNTLMSVSTSNPFGIQIPDAQTRAQLADVIEQNFAQSGKTPREREVYNAVARLLGLEAEVNLGA